ncbi:hypothetical protein DPV78_000640 [Talaromyces pinophilus]|nr:hypothetical protein DPV78_000640 [Talaromyces pinophilus]
MGSLYDYDPSVSAAIIFAVLYSIVGVTTTYQYIALRCWFWIFMVIASLMETVGYIVRILSAKDPTSTLLYAVSFLPIFLAPAVIAASCYMAMGRIVLHVTPMNNRSVKSLWVPPRWMTPIFVTGDLISFMIQVIGGLKSVSGTSSDKQSAFDIMKIGLAVQLVCFGLFLIISFRFHFVSKSFKGYWPDTRWPKFLWILNISACLVFVRSVYRMIEFCSGYDGYLATHEWNFYVFESLIILPIFLLFNIWHPARYISNIGWRQKRANDTLLQPYGDMRADAQVVGDVERN